MSSTSIRSFATASVAAGLLGAGALLAPAVAMAQPVAPSDVLKIDSPELQVQVNGDTAHFTITAPDDMACVGPLVVEGSISESDIDPENYDETFFEELFDEPVWPTEEKDLHVVVNEGSPLADQPGASVSPLEVSVPGLHDGDYVATSVCVSEDYVDVPTLSRQLDGPDQVSALQDARFPLEMHFRNFSVTTTGSVNLGSVDVFGSIGSIGS
mgnify:CR=1 FL=1